MLKKLPNILTIFRIVLIIPILWAIYVNLPWLAFGLYVLATVTDFFDGILARKLNVISGFGTFLDPIADKLLIVALLLVFTDVSVIDGYWTLAAIVILLREILVSGLREYLGPYKITLPVTKLAKWKTTLQMVAIGLLMVSKPLFGSHEIGLYFLALSATITFITGWDYMVKGLSEMKKREGKDVS